MTIVPRRERTPTSRYGTMHPIASTVLASPAAAYITGQIIKPMAG